MTSWEWLFAWIAMSQWQYLCSVCARWWMFKGVSWSAAIRGWLIYLFLWPICPFLMFAIDKYLESYKENIP